MADRPFELNGINHLALVCRDMARTVDFYTNVLGMPLIKTIELPAGMGQHFFFDCGGGDSLAFFWFPDAPEPAPGVSAPAARPDQGDLTSAIGSMNHVAFDVSPDQIERVPRPAARRRRRLHRGGQPRRQRVGHHQGAAPGRVRALDLLPGPRRHPARVRLLDARRSVPTTWPSSRARRASTPADA